MRLFVVEVLTEDDFGDMQSFILQICETEEQAFELISKMLAVDQDAGESDEVEGDGDVEPESDGDDEPFVKYEAEGYSGPYRVRELTLNKFYGWHNFCEDTAAGRAAN